jgi:hypothetical protein
VAVGGDGCIFFSGKNGSFAFSYKLILRHFPTQLIAMFVYQLHKYAKLHLLELFGTAAAAGIGAGGVF